MHNLMMKNVHFYPGPAYLSVSLMKGIILLLELRFSLLQSANWMKKRNNCWKYMIIHDDKASHFINSLAKCGSNCRPAGNQVFLPHIFYHLILWHWLCGGDVAVITSHSQQRATMHQQTLPELHQVESFDNISPLWITDSAMKSNSYHQH